MPLYPNWWENPNQGFIGPSPIVLEDREDGTLYMLTHDADTDEVTLTSVPARVNTFASEPLIVTKYGLRKLFVSSGTLSLEAARSREAGREDEPVFTLNFTDRTTTYAIRGGDSVYPYLSLYKHTGVGREEVITLITTTLAFAGSADLYVEIDYVAMGYVE